MSTEIVPFNFDGEQVRVVTIDGEPWFVLADLCAVLSLSNPSVVASRIDEAALSLTEVRSGGQRRSVTIVSEAGMYEVVIRSDKPEAAAFRRWITGTVLPEIRKTGSYAKPLTLAEKSLLLLTELTDEVQRQAAQITVLTPRADAWDELASAEGDYEVADAAKILARGSVETGRQRLFGQLEQLGWIYRGSHGKWSAYQSAVDAGYLAEKPQSHHHPRTGELVLDPPQVRVTINGIERLRVLLSNKELAVNA